MTSAAEQQKEFYSHVNFSVTKIRKSVHIFSSWFYSHVNFSVTKIIIDNIQQRILFYSHVNFSVTKMAELNYTTKP